MIDKGRGHNSTQNIKSISQSTAEPDSPKGGRLRKWGRSAADIALFVPRKAAALWLKAVRRLSVTAKMLMVFGSVFVVIAVCVALLAVVHAERSVLADHSAQINEYYVKVNRALSAGSGMAALDALNIELDVLDIDMAVVSSAGEFVWGTVSPSSSVYGRLVGGGQESYAYKLKGSYVSAGISAAGGAYTVYARKDIKGDYGQVFQVKVLAITMVPLALIILLVFGGLAGRQILRPVRKMTGKIRSITRETIAHTRLTKLESDDEFAELASVFNTMLDNLEESFVTQERFVSDASHELKTPIAVLHGYSQMLGRWGKEDPEILNESIEAIRNETEHMKNLVEMLMFLSRSNSKDNRLKIERVEISALLESVIKEVGMTDKNHGLITGKVEEVAVEGDRQLIKQLIRIISDNALKYTPDNGTVTFGCYAEDGYGYIVVKDTGIGISEEDLPYVFNRFYRADKARNRQSGSGLGLAIAKKIADAHNADIIISSSIGKGTVVNIKIPLFVEVTVAEEEI